MEKKRITARSLAVLAGAGIAISGIGFTAIATAEESPHGFGSSDIPELVTGSAETGSSVGSKVVDTGSSVASEGLNLVFQLTGSGSSALESGSSTVPTLFDLLSSGSSAANSLSTNLLGHE